MLKVKIRKRSVQIPVESRISSSGFALSCPLMIAKTRESHRRQANQKHCRLEQSPSTKGYTSASFSNFSEGPCRHTSEPPGPRNH